MVTQVTEGKVDLTRKYLIPGTIWKEPKRSNRSSPTMTAKAVAKQLGFTNVESVHILARRGPEHGGLPGYISNEEGTGWERKIVPMLTKEQKQERRDFLASLSKEEYQALKKRLKNMSSKERATLSPVEQLLYDTHSGVQLFFYPEDIQAWKTAHPFIEKERERVPYQQGEFEYVIREAEQMKNADGSVTRTRLFNHLAEMQGVKLWNTRTYAKLKQILDDAGYPLPPQMPKDTSLRRTLRRKYS